ncbi:MAG: flagellar biosynthetic protein FliR [Myxococcota bacterium]|nr:flagellar biosynthetic protein FliR [Myxococcota bacterium]
MDRLIDWLGGSEAIGRALAVGWLVAMRLAPLALLAPWLTPKGAPVVFRTALLLALTVAMYPSAAAAAPEVPTAAVTLVALSGREVVVGLLFAIVTALPFFAFDWAGRLVDTWRGAAMSEVIAPPTGERTSPVGDLKLLLAVAVFCALGGHVLALGALGRSFVTLPVGGPAAQLDAGAAALGVARLFGDAVALSLSITAPAAVALVAVEIALGLLARAAPQIPVFFAGMPLRAAVGLLAVLLAARALVELVPGAVEAGLRAAIDLVLGGSVRGP